MSRLMETGGDDAVQCVSSVDSQPGERSSSVATSSPPYRAPVVTRSVARQRSIGATSLSSRDPSSNAVAGRPQDGIASAVSLSRNERPIGAAGQARPSAVQKRSDAARLYCCLRNDADRRSSIIRYFAYRQHNYCRIQ